MGWRCSINTCFGCESFVCFSSGKWLIVAFFNVRLQKHYVVLIYVIQNWRTDVAVACAAQGSLPAQQWMCNGTLLNDARTTQWLSLQANVWDCRTDLATSSNQWVSFSIHIFIQLNMSVHVKTKVVQRGHDVLCMFLCLQRPGLLHLGLICKPWEWASRSVCLRLHLVLTCPCSSPPESTKGQ